MLADLIRQGYREGRDLNCSESILYSANQANELGLSENISCKLRMEFSGGIRTEILTLYLPFIKRFDSTQTNKEVSEYDTNYRMVQWTTK